MLKCREVSSQASDYIDHELQGMQRLNMALHLLLCGRCRRFVRQLRLAVGAIRTARASCADAPDAETVRKIVQRIRTGQRYKP